MRFLHGNSGGYLELERWEQKPVVWRALSLPPPSSPKKDFDYILHAKLCYTMKEVIKVGTANQYGGLEKLYLMLFHAYSRHFILHFLEHFGTSIHKARFTLQ